MEQLEYMKTIKKLFAVLLAVTVLTVSVLVLSSCSSNSETTGDVDISSHWVFYSVTGDDGTTTYRFPWESEEDLPFFVCDGTDFQISTVQGSVHGGTVTENEDGTYTLTMDKSGNEFQAKIEGNMLTIYFSDGRELAFEAD